MKMPNTIKKLTSLALAFSLVFALFVFAPVPANAYGDAFSTISAGANYTMAIKSDGTLWAWGSNFNGFLGDGTTENKNVPVKIMDNVAQVSAGSYHSVAIKSDGSLWVWGSNAYGQLGDGTTENKSTPIKIMDNVVQVCAGGSHTLAIKGEGSLWAWGRNDRGQLGDGTTTDKSSPVKIMDDVICVSAGDNHTMAIKSDGSLWAWGNNWDGRLGDGTTKNKNTPVKVLDNVIRVSANQHTMAIKSDGSLWAWGSNGYGQLGDGTNAEKHAPVKIMDNVAQVSVGDYYTIAMKGDGTLWAWGRSANGRLGDNGTAQNKNTPVKIMDDASQVSAGNNHTIAQKSDGSLWAWGDNRYGKLGDGTTAEEQRVPVKIMDNVMISSGTIAKPTSAPDPVLATATSSKVLVDGEQKAFDAYNIGGNNYFKLRDLAYVLSGTKTQFEVGWDGAKNAITLTSGNKYTQVGGEMATKGTGSKNAIPTTSRIYLDGKEVQFTAYNIDGNNYFKLRDIGLALKFGVDWDAKAESILINTKTYRYTYLDSTRGSAKSLEGKTLVVSIFANLDGYDKWTQEDISLARDNLNTVKHFIETEGEKYGVDVDLICDFKTYPDLCYEIDIAGEYYDFNDDVWDNLNLESQLENDKNLSKITNMIEKDDLFIKLCDKYETGSIAYIVFLKKVGRSAAVPFTALYAQDPDGHKTYYHEKAIVFTEDKYGLAYPGVCAHELLHLFGAVDFYQETVLHGVRQEMVDLSNFYRDGVSQEMVDYVKKNYPNEIMSTVRKLDENNQPVIDRIEKEISPLTAYRIGWLDYIPELEMFPEFREKKW
ncbi:MAG: hypothetical protein FWH48_03195 [Oscillospiraceae bacterium]|nr:hypothetical protein [Oscillospiraceae bacterium]